MLRIWLYLLLLSLLSTIGRSQVYTIRSLAPPVKCVGGEPCAFQPSVGVYDSSGNLAIDFIGSAYAQMQTSPTGFEPLYVGTCDYTSCGTKVVGATASATFVNGVAEFSVSIFFTRHRNVLEFYLTAYDQLLCRI